MYSIEQNKITFKDDYYELNFVEIIQNHNETNETKIDEIYFGKYFNQDISLLPQYITKIFFDEHSHFNKQINFLPNSLTHLQLGDYFNQQIDNLPYKLTHLKLGDFFNQPLDNLPEELTHLELDCSWFYSIDNLPDSLTHLKLGHFFNQWINRLPKNLIELTLSKMYRRPLNLNSVPKNCLIKRYEEGILFY